MPSAPILIRNTTKGPVVFSASPTDYVEWQGAGDPMGGDYQPVSPTWVDNPQFRRMMTRKILVVEEADAETEAALAKHEEDWNRRAADRANASKDSLDQAPNNDLIVRKCLGPGSKPGENCGTEVSVKVQDQEKKPPLCTQHEHMAGQFVPEATDRLVGGKQEVVWKSISMGRRETDQP
jgi:hypothetical protein